MKVAIIGAGNVGTALATSIARAGHDVIITSRDPEDAASAAEAAGARVAKTNAAAAAEAEVVIPAVSFGDVPQVAREIAGPAAGKPVVDVTNRIGFGASGPEIDTTSSNAEAIAKLLPKSPIVKAFNTLFAGNTANPQALGFQLDSLFATDDDAAKDAVCGLSTSIGFRPIHVGPLAAARELEAMAWLNIRLQMLASGDWKSSFVLVDAPDRALAA
jgi:NADPH-dependent F420 reductase